MPKATGYQIQELESLEETIKSGGWRIIKNILNEHRISLVEQSHRALRKHEDRKASEFLARSDETIKILSLIQAKKEELSKIIEEGNKEV